MRTQINILFELIIFLRTNMKVKIRKSNEEWRRDLTPKEFYILREKGTEPPFTGNHLYNEEKGRYLCTGCGNDLFSSETKYNSGTGWPSFWAPILQDRLEMKEDKSLGMRRTEVSCSRCGGHLGHVFNDGPKPTGQRFCINSIALHFKKDSPESRD